MTKKEYLESRGYIRRIVPECRAYYYQKSFDNVFMVIDIQLDDFVIWTNSIRYQKDIDKLQIAFNNVKRDFEEMQKYEEE